MKTSATAVLIFCLFSATAIAAEASRSTSSIQWQDGVGEVVMHGPGRSVMNGDKVELTNGTLYLNGQSYGPVPGKAEMRYVVTATSRTLYVDGKARTPLVKK